MPIARRKYLKHRIPHGPRRETQSTPGMDVQYAPNLGCGAKAVGEQYAGRSNILF
jgi:hypothetical protein